MGRKKTDDPEIQKLQKNIHAGHRQRMRKKLLSLGLESFEDYQTLELLLFYAVPRRDTNETAHMLIRRFGSLAGVLDASEKELQTIPGIGPKAARLLHTIPPLLDRLANATEAEEVFLKTPKDVRKLLVDRLQEDPMPFCCVLLMDNTNLFLGLRCYPGAQLPELQQLLGDVITTRATQLVLVEVGTGTDRSPWGEHALKVHKLAEDLECLQFHVWNYFWLADLNSHMFSFLHRGMLLGI